MDFALLQERLVALIRERVRSGEVTERGLATLAGVSQPHVHNVLKGARRLSTDMADHLLRRLRIDLSDLIEEDDIRYLRVRQPRNYRAVPCLSEPLGPGKLLPQEGGEFYPFRSEQVDMLEDPVVARVGEDDQLPPPLQEDDWVLLDRGERARLSRAEGLYVVQIRQEALIRGVRPAGAVWEVVAPPRVYVQDRAILEVMKAKVVWFGRRLEFPQIG
jgi:transcriptional regulator with XRE-family HTH domain